MVPLGATLGTPGDVCPWATSVEATAAGAVPLPLAVDSPSHFALLAWRSKRPSDCQHWCLPWWSSLWGTYAGEFRRTPSRPSILYSPLRTLSTAERCWGIYPISCSLTARAASTPGYDRYFARGLFALGDGFSHRALGVSTLHLCRPRRGLWTVARAHAAWWQIPKDSPRRVRPTCWL
jgi:hypothetical protein